MADIDDLFLEHLGASLSKQMTLLRAVEGLPCDIDLDSGEAKFGDRYTFPIQILGFEQEEDDEADVWAWSWAFDEDSIPTDLTQAALAIKEFGEKHDLDILYVASYEIEDIGGDELGILGCGLTDAASFFVANTEEDVAYFLIPDLGGQIPDDRPAAFIAEVITEMLESYELEEPQPALRFYLRYEGYTLEEAPGRWTARHPGGGHLTLAFDDQGRLGKLDASEGA
jgi:hypothetical protein